MSQFCLAWITILEFVWQMPFTCLILSKILWPSCSECRYASLWWCTISSCNGRIPSCGRRCQVPPNYKGRNCKCMWGWRYSWRNKLLQVLWAFSIYSFSIPKFSHSWFFAAVIQFLIYLLSGLHVWLLLQKLVTLLSLSFTRCVLITTLLVYIIQCTLYALWMISKVMR